MKAVLALSLVLLCLLPTHAQAAQVDITAPSAILMEKSTGEILFEQDSHAVYEPASVTKIMTLLLVMEAIDAGSLSWDDVITASPYACSMGGSQIWLKEGEQLTVSEMVKAVAVASANDCAVALAEAIAGSESAFVQRMNERAKELGMESTVFYNCTGLPAEGHVSSAYDIALMSRELILNHPQLREYTTIWMDTLRDGQFQLTNTNRLIYSYPGATGLKTGSTDAALYCLSATAERDDMELIAVVMHAATPTDRFDSAAALLNYGFANYALTQVYPDDVLPPVSVLLGEQSTVQPELAHDCTILTQQSQSASITTQIHLPQQISAPVEEGQKLGEMVVYLDGNEHQRVDLVASHGVARLTTWGIFRQLLDTLLFLPT
ncbi:D-alanyl-D-alanine carboxypeptidase family protein [Pseudoflavonifractor sp. An85]|uniref:D-alanyl-D-alanine carboxypeptidase family protein n=1 Tax=Pseudoflavonifractor sp. An85 TaxID=1965661 RepID=UPI000B36ACAF|nr:D-alanyl-D-alanine carboxypeptidase family protein [Pseudoflavonifractor sp. An85]OUN22766.1 D-alanyl-D-alanine carboxypeptidase [Pseudoflavonifractor sp. An85]